MTVYLQLGSATVEGITNGRLVVYNAYHKMDFQGGVRDCNFANKLIDDITSGDTNFVKGEPEYEDYQPLFLVTIDITNTKKQFGGTSQFVIEYQLLNPSCPLKVRERGMELYRYFKKKKRECEAKTANDKRERRLRCEAIRTGNTK